MEFRTPKEIWASIYEHFRAPKLVLPDITSSTFIPVNDIIFTYPINVPLSAET